MKIFSIYCCEIEESQQTGFLSACFHRKWRIMGMDLDLKEAVDVNFRGNIYFVRNGGKTHGILYDL